MAEELADTHAAEGAAPGITSGGELGEQRESKPEKAPSLRETLNKSIKEVRDKEERATKPVLAEKPEKTPESSAKPEKDAQPKAVSKPAGPPPWMAKKADIWEKLPPEAREERSQRETEIQKGFDDYKAKTAQFAEIQQALAPIRPLLQQSGIENEAQAVKKLLEWEGSFRNPQTRIQAFHALAQQYGIDLTQFAQGSNQGAPEIPEHLRPVYDQFGQLSQAVNSIQNRLQSAEQERVNTDLSSFAKDKPHFEKVRYAMGQLLQAGMAKDLDDAYQRALRLDTEVWQQVQAEEQQKKAADEAKARAEAARKAQAAAISPAPRARQGTAGSSQEKGRNSVRGSILASIGQLMDDQRA
jgi:hypothetical protein